MFSGQLVIGSRARKAERDSQECGPGKTKKSGWMPKTEERNR